MPITATGTSLTTPQFSSYCLDAEQSLDLGTSTFTVAGHVIPPAVDATGHATQIAYLYNRYGTTHNSIEGERPSWRSGS